MIESDLGNKYSTPGIMRQERYSEKRKHPPTGKNIIYTILKD